MEDVKINDLPKKTPKSFTNAKVPSEEDENDKYDFDNDDQIEDETPVRDEDFIEDFYGEDEEKLKPRDKNDVDVCDVDEGIDMDYS